MFQGTPRVSPAPFVLRRWKATVGISFFCPPSCLAVSSSSSRNSSSDRDRAPSAASSSSYRSILLSSSSCFRCLATGVRGMDSRYKTDFLPISDHRYQTGSTGGKRDSASYSRPEDGADRRGNRFPHQSFNPSLSMSKAVGSSSFSCG